MRIVLAALLVLCLVIAAASRVQAYGTWPFVGGSAAATSTPSPPPLFIPIALDIDPANSHTPDMGATPDVNLAYMLQVANENTTSNGCTSPCNLTKYTDMLDNHCSTVAENAAMTWAYGVHETAFLHIYGAGQTQGNEMLNHNSSATTCNAYTGGTYAQYFNPDDSGFASWIYTNVWANTGSHYYPSPYGPYEDDAGIGGEYICGPAVSSANYPSGEYSIGWNGGVPSPCNFAGVSGQTYGGGSATFATYVQGESYLVALAHYVNNACQATCLKVVLNGASELGNDNATNLCTVVVASHCHGNFTTSIVDDQYNFDAFCSALTAGNLIGMDQEKPIFGEWPGSTYASPAQLIVLINGNIRFYNTPACNGWKLMQFEYDFGSGGPAVPADSTQIQARTLKTAIQWLTPDPSTGILDRIIYHENAQGGVDGAVNEAPVYFEDTLVPWEPEQTTATFVWNGGTVTVGGGCPASGDTGGAIALLAVCVNQSGDGAGIYCQQYQHLYINGTDKGKAAACVDTSASQNPTIASSWFPHDSWTSYNDTLTLSSGMLNCVRFTGVNSGSGTGSCPTNNNIALPTCTDANCINYPSAGTQSTAWSSGSPGTICAAAGPPCGIIFTANALP